MAFSFYATIKELPIGIDRHGCDQMEVRILNDSITQVHRIWEPKKPLALEALALREAFLKVRTFEQAVTFLQISGPFIDEQPGVKRQTITWTEFQEWQALTRRVMLGGHMAPLPTRLPKLSSGQRTPEMSGAWEWFTDPRLEAREHSPGIWFMCNTALQTIAATIYADKWLRHVTFKECPFPSCNKLFEAITVGGHEKQYCTPDHSRRAAKARALTS